MNDLTIVGSCKKADGIGQNSLGFVTCLHPELQINVVHTCSFCGDGLSDELISVFNKPFSSAGRVAILTSSIFWYNSSTIHEYLPQESHIKIAYSMIESTQLAPEGVEFLNEVFDAVVVPDSWVAEVYLASGVVVPIFVLPLAVDLEDFLSEPIHERKGSPLAFLNTCAFMERKNHLTLINAFYEAFGNRSDVKLLLHGRRGSSSDALTSIEERLEELDAKNIHLQRVTLSRQEYVQLMKSADCFVSLSKGEGFGVPAREALALGVPCILTNNSAQKTCCDTGLIRSVPSSIAEEAYCPLIFRYHGHEYNCRGEDAVAALLDMERNYDSYLKKAHEGRKWVQKYLPASLRKFYLNLVKPTQVILGDRNEIGETYLMTSSPQLYEKYQTL